MLMLLFSLLLSIHIFSKNEIAKGKDDNNSMQKLSFYKFDYKTRRENKIGSQCFMTFDKNVKDIL